MKYKFILCIAVLCIAVTACSEKSVDNNTPAAAADENKTEYVYEEKAEKTPEEIEKEAYFAEIKKIDDITSSFIKNVQDWESKYNKKSINAEEAKKDIDLIKTEIEKYDEIINMENVPEKYIEPHKVLCDKLVEIKKAMTDYTDNMSAIADGDKKALENSEKLKNEIGNKVAEMGICMNDVYGA